MLDRRIRLVSEAMARSLNRRKFLRDSGSAIFASMAALAAGQAFAGSASAAVPKPKSPAINCAPPGPYCNTGGGDLSGCQGAHCFQHLSNNQIVQCHVYYAFYPAGCWTSAGSGGYWTCCDCQCTSGATCGCAQFSATPGPRPDGPQN